MQTADLYSRRPDLPATEVGDEVFLVIPEGQEIIHLDSMAAALWRLLESALTMNAIVDTFVAAFPDTPGPQVRADVLAALGELEEQKVLLVARSWPG